MQRSSYKIVSYRVKHSYDVGEFLSYRYLLQRAIDIIWEGIEWKRKGKRLIPIIPKSRLKILTEALSNVVRVLKGGEPENVVNLE